MSAAKCSMVIVRLATLIATLYLVFTPGEAQLAARKFRHFRESEEEPIYVVSSAHENPASHSRSPASPSSSSSSSLPSSTITTSSSSSSSSPTAGNAPSVVNDNTRDEEILVLSESSASAQFTGSPVTAPNAGSSPSDKVLNATKISLMEPLTQLVLLYLANRADAQNRSLTKNETTPMTDLGKDGEDKNGTLSESRTLASWISSTLGWKKKRRNGQRPLPHRSDYFGQRPPPVAAGVTGFPLSPMAPPASLPGFRPNFLPNPEGFPGPFNPDSILLPSDPKFSPELNVGETADFNYRPRRKRPRPMTITRPIKMRQPTAPPFEENDTKQKHHESSPRCDKFTSHICVDDFEYPEQAIVDEIYKRRDLFELMYSEVKDNSPMVDGVPRDVEESYTYEHYFSEPPEEKLDPMASGSEFRDDSSSGYICPSEVLYGKPKLARNVRGLWKVIVNAAEFTQTVRMEKCLRPNDKCNHISSSKVSSRCAQVHSVHRLMVFEKGKGFYIDTFRIPTACSCHVSRRTTYTIRPNHPLQTNSVSAGHEKNPSAQLSNSLWSMLGSNGNNLPENVNVDTSSLLNSDILRSQLALLQQIKNQQQQFGGQLSPESLLQQLSESPLASLSALEKYQAGKLLNQNRPGLEYLLPSLLYGSADGLPLNLQAPQQQILQNPQGQQMVAFQQQPQAQGPGQVQAPPQTTTYIRPGNGNGAPVVQVIHVPVTSTNPFPGLPQAQNSLFNSPVAIPGFNGLSAFESKTSTKNTDKAERTILRPTSLRSKSNSTVNFDDSHTATARERAKEKRKPTVSEHSVNSDEESNVLMKRKNSDDEKINFSYHPILEYIKSPPKEA